MSRTENIPIRKGQSLSNEIAELNERIMRRAFEIFENRGGADLDNWLTAENELVWKPQMELTEKDNEMLLSMAVPGIEAKQIQIEATPEALVVKAESRHEHREEKGSVHACEFHCGNMFRSVHFPKRIDPEKVKAEVRNGMLSIHAPVAEDQRTRKVSIEAA